MKLNRKGYMTIEIILAAVVTFVIAFFLIDITMKLSSNTDDAYSDTVLVTDKTLITKNIKENLENDIEINGYIKSIVVDCITPDICTNIEITYANNSSSMMSLEGNVIKYTDYARNVIYSKEIDKSLTNVSLSGNKADSYVLIIISGENIFMDENYEMNIFVYNPVPR